MREGAVVTGAGRGIGRAIALALAGRGLDIALLGRTEADLEAVAREIEAKGGGAVPLRCDVACSAEVDAAARTVIDAMGPPRVVVNNAGIVRRSVIEETEEADWDAVVDVNLKGAFLVTRAFLPSMRAKRGGRFVHIASISSTLGTPRLASYCAAKWGLLGFHKALAEELRGTGLETLAVLPGSVDTKMLEGSGFAPAMSPEDVASVVAYAALDAPAAANGSSIEVFG